MELPCSADERVATELGARHGHIEEEAPVDQIGAQKIKAVRTDTLARVDEGDIRGPPVERLMGED
jgi:hypothetical protein